MKYVIIGASAAGLAAAEQIRKTDPAGAVTLLTRETDLPYSRPSISYYLKGWCGGIKCACAPRLTIKSKK